MLSMTLADSQHDVTRVRTYLFTFPPGSQSKVAGGRHWVPAPLSSRGEASAGSRTGGHGGPARRGRSAQPCVQGGWRARPCCRDRVECAFLVVREGVPREGEGRWREGLAECGCWTPCWTSALRLCELRTGASWVSCWPSSSPPGHLLAVQLPFFFWTKNKQTKNPLKLAYSMFY